MARHTRQHEVEDITTDVVEVDVDEAPGGVSQGLFEAGGFVVDAGVGAEAFDPAALVVGAGDTDDPFAAEHVLGDLHDHTTGGTRGATNNDGVVWSCTGDVADAVKGGQAGHTEGAEELRGFEAGDVGDGRAVGGVGDAVFRPAGVGGDHRAFFEVFGGRFEDFGDGAGFHDFAFVDGRHVEAFGVDVLGDPAALGGVIGDVESLEEELVRF